MKIKVNNCQPRWLRGGALAFQPRGCGVNSRPGRVFFKRKKSLCLLSFISLFFLCFLGTKDLLSLKRVKEPLSIIEKTIETKQHTQHRLFYFSALAKTIPSINPQKKEGN
uniref:Uncharacterized protein n=1 Tax=Cacopsylla melanoneura TaxID=428564 RepID=A0A8D8S6J1_9HEMI